MNAMITRSTRIRRKPSVIMTCILLGELPSGCGSGFGGVGGVGVGVGVGYGG